MDSYDLGSGKTAMLPKSLAVKDCSAVPNIQLRFGCDDLACELLLGILNPIIGGILADPIALGEMLCGQAFLMEAAVDLILQNLNFKVVERQWLLPARQLEEPPLSDSATNIEELLLDGVMGHVIQTIIHDGAKDMTDTPELLKLLKLFPGIIGLDIDFDNLPQSFKSSLKLPFGIGDLDFDANVPTCDKIELMSPLAAANVTKYSLSVAPNPVTFKKCGTAMNLKFTSGTSHIVGSPLQLSPRLNASVDQVTGHAAILLGINGNDLSSKFALDQLVHAGCATQAFDSTDPSSVKLLGLGAGSNAFELLLSDDSDDLLDSVLRGASETVNTFFTAFGPTLTLAFHGRAMDSLVTVVNNLIQGVVDSPGDCPTSVWLDIVPDGVVGIASVWTALFGVVALLFGVAVLGACCVRVMKRLEKRAARPTDSSTDAEGVAAPASQTVPDRTLRRSNTLSSHPGMSRAGSRALTFLNIANLGLLFVGAVGLNSQVLIVFSDTDPVGGGPQVQQMDKTLDLSLWRLAMMFNEQGMWPVCAAFILVGFVLPLSQGVGLLAILHLPTQVLSEARRGQAVKLLAAGGRVGLADSIAFTVIFGAMTMHLTGTQSGSTSRFQAGIVPQYGMFIFFSANVMSLAIREATVRAQRRADNWPNARKKMESDGGAGSLLSQGDAEALVQTEAAVRNPSEAVPMSHLVVSSAAVQALTWFLLAATPVLVMVGLFMQSYSFTFGGLFGIVKYVLNGDLTTKYSVVTMLAFWQWPEGGSSDNVVLVIGTILLLGGFAWFLIVAPLLHSFCMAILWAAPMTERRQRGFADAANTLYNWQVLDLFVVLLCGIIVLKQEVSYLFCLLISTQSSLAPLVKPFYERSDDVVLTILAGFEPGLVVLVLAVVVQTAATFLLDRQVKKVL